MKVNYYLISLLIISTVSIASPQSIHQFITLFQSDKPIRSVSLIPNGSILAAGALDYKVRVYRFNGSHMLINQTLQQARSYILKVKMNDNGTYIYTVCADRFLRVYIYNGTYYNLLQNIQEPTIVNSVDATYDCNTIATVNQIGYTTVYNFNGSLYNLNQRFRDTNYDYFMKDVRITADGQYLTTGGRDNMARIYSKQSTNKYTLYQTISDNHEYITSVEMTNDYRYLVVGGFNGFIRIYEFNGSKWNSIQNITYYFLIYSLSLTNDGQYLLVGGEFDKVQLYSNQNNTFNLTSNITDAIYGTQSVQIVDSGQFMVTGSLDNLLRVYFECKSDGCSNCSWQNVCCQCKMDYILENDYTCQYQKQQGQSSYWYVAVIVPVVVIPSAIVIIYLVKKFKLLRMLSNQRVPLSET